MIKYYNLHVFYSRNFEFSVPLAIDTDKFHDEFLGDDEIINYAIELNLIDEYDVNQIYSIMEIYEEQFLMM